VACGPLSAAFFKLVAENQKKSFKSMIFMESIVFFPAPVQAPRKPNGFEAVDAL
jgi:hypothetical protein